VITKVAPLIEVALGASTSVVASAVHESIFRSCHALGLPKLQTVLLHRAADGERAGVWEALQGLQAEGVVGLLGVSVQTPSEAMVALDNPLVRHLQLPFNFLDYRWEEAGVIERLGTRPDVTVHVRSALLQGVLPSSDPGVWPVVPGVDVPGLISTLARMAHDLGRRSVVDLCIGYVLGHRFVDGVVVGMETLAQLEDNLSLFTAPALDEGAVALVKGAVPRVPEALLDPARWPTRTP
jgi:aryl-alcohol dehydrogenase-like predicted oxidoreductase